MHGGLTLKTLKIAGLGLWIFALSVTAPIEAARAGTLEDGVKAFAKKEYEAAAKLLKPLAEKGNAVAQYRIAMMHRMGLGFKKDRKEAQKWSALAAKQGNADAQQLLGSLYYKGEGAEPDDVSKAYMWYDVAAAQGNEEAKKDRDNVAKELNPQQLAAAREKAQKCKVSKFAQCD